MILIELIGLESTKIPLYIDWYNDNSLEILHSMADRDNGNTIHKVQYFDYKVCMANCLQSDVFDFHYKEYI